LRVSARLAYDCVKIGAAAVGDFSLENSDR
jgi:hypothetical protein